MKRREIAAAALPAIGQPFMGGFYAGRLFYDAAEHAVIDSGRAYECSAQWWDHEGPRPRIRGTVSRYDGLANTKAMAAEGSAIARKVLALNVRGTWGWHIPAIEELQLMRANLLQLPDWEHRLCYHAAQAFAQFDYWSSTQKGNAATAYYSSMRPWSDADTNWISKCKGIRPVRTLRIIDEPYVHEAASDIATNVAVSNLKGLAEGRLIEEVLGQFVNEDAGRFYGRTQDLVEQLAQIGREARA